jgi:hypothetical protein
MPPRSPTVWSLRSKALQAQGKLDEAMTLLDEQIKQDPEAKWIGAKRRRPRSDPRQTRGKELFKADPASEEAEKLWRKARATTGSRCAPRSKGREAVRVAGARGRRHPLARFRHALQRRSRRRWSPSSTGRDPRDDVDELFRAGRRASTRQSFH